MKLLRMAPTVLALLACSAALGGDDDFVPFVIPHGEQTGSLIKFAHKPIPAKDRVVARDGRFYVGDNRLRVWGVNTCFGANFPTHAEAERIAARMADFGINSVRFHHMDSAHFPRGIWDKADPNRLSTEALDRLDYFIDQLARRGIYANINLHVSRTHSRYLKLPDRDKLRNYDKIVDIFTPELIAAQKRYARMLLTHVNKYRKLRYADDPAIAFVEINNEDSLFMWGADRTLTSLPPYYAKILQDKFVGWLAKRYGSDAKLRAAWAKGAEPLGANVLTPVATSRTRKWAGWVLGSHFECRAAPVKTKDGVRIEITRADPTSWHIQYMHPDLSLKAGRYYTVSFRARASKPRKIDFNVGRNHEPWGMLGLVRGVELTKDWRTVRAGFIASGDDNNARVCFQLSGSDAAVELADVQLRPGGREGLGKGESIKARNVKLFADGETDARMIDRWRFLAETEKAYFDDMYAFIKTDLDVKALVTGTVVFGPCGLYAQSGMDYIDAHAYWRHPRFPGRPWDPGNWLVEQDAMIDRPGESTLWRLAAQRLEGKPFTVSEYNHPAPNDFQAECVPMVASFAAAQDWDGVWLFAYSHRTGDAERDSFTSFFDIDANPGKWGFVPAGTAIFRDGAIGPLKVAEVAVLRDSGDGFADMANLHRAFGRDMAAIWSKRTKMAWPMPLRARMRVSLGRKPPPTRGKPPLTGSGAPAEAVRSGVLLWPKTTPGGGLFEVHTGARVWVGRKVSKTRLGDIELRTPAFAAIAITPLDGRASLAASRKILLTACGRSENTGMKFSKDRRTVGLNWGSGPVRIEAVTATVQIPPGQWRCQALGPDGRAAGDVPVKRNVGGQHIELSPKHKTMWYLLTRK